MVLGGSRRSLEARLAALGLFLGCSSPLSAALGRSLDALEVPLGRPWPLLGAQVAGLGRFMADSGPVLAALGWLLAALGVVLGRSWPPKMLQVEHKDVFKAHICSKASYFKKYWKTPGKTMILPSKNDPKRAKMPPRWPSDRSRVALGRS